MSGKILKYYGYLLLVVIFGPLFIIPLFAQSTKDLLEILNPLLKEKMDLLSENQLIEEHYQSELNSTYQKTKSVIDSKRIDQIGQYDLYRKQGLEVWKASLAVISRLHESEKRYSLFLDIESCIKVATIGARIAITIPKTIKIAFACLSLSLSPLE